MKNKFEPGDLVFVVDTSNSVRLGEFDRTYSSKASQIIDSRTGECYFGFGYKATPENRQALVTLYGEDVVPKLSLRGSELTKKLLERQKYVICWVSNCSDEYARDNSRMAHMVTEVEDDGFTLSYGGFVEYAVPVDNNGNEIMGYEE